VFRETAYPLGRGWFAVPRNGGQELCFFTLGEDLLLRREQAGFFEGALLVEAGIDGEGKSYFAVNHGDGFSLYRGDGGAFLREQISSGDEPEGGGEADYPEDWIPLFTWGFDPVNTCFLLPATGELAAGHLRTGFFEVRERRALAGAGAETGTGADARYRKSLAVNGTLHAAVLAEGEIILYRILSPEENAGGEL
jgi:hypothetical protein